VILISKTYDAYLKTGNYSIAVQGRYLFPILGPFVYILALGWNDFLRKTKQFRLIFLFLLFFVLNQLGPHDVFLALLFKPEYNMGYLKASWFKKMVEWYAKLPWVAWFYF